MRELTDDAKRRHGDRCVEWRVSGARAVAVRRSRSLSALSTFLSSVNLLKSRGSLWSLSTTSVFTPSKIYDEHRMCVEFHYETNIAAIGWLPAELERRSWAF